MKTNRKSFSLFAILMAVIAADTLGYMLIEKAGPIDALYMTIISITTVGYREVIALSQAGILFTIWVILSGIGLVFYITVTIAEDMFESRVRNILGRRKMKKFSELKNHVVIAGFGRMGEHICKELLENKRKFVILENNQDRFAAAEEKGYNVLLNDATEEESLLLAGLDRAKTFISLLSTDADNIFTVLSAREINRDIFIITRAMEIGSDKKLCKIGANRVILPYELSSRRVVNMVLKPNVVDFIDSVSYQATDISLSIEEYTILEDSPFAGKMIKDSGLRENHNAMVVAVKRGGDTIFNPSPTESIKTGDILILVGETDRMHKIF